MAKIFFSMAGEGRGHATRARTIVDLLRREHQITLFAPQFAYDLLSETYVNSDVRLYRIPGLLFHYQQERLSFARTIWGAGEYLLQLPALVRRLEQEIDREEPDLIVSDFEPALPRAARGRGVPIVSLDHQHFLVVSDLSCLPAQLRLKAAGMGRIVEAYCRGQTETIVSSFYFPPLKSRYRSSVVQTGVLLRDSVIAAEPEKCQHIVVYLRRYAPPRLLESLQHTNREVHIYGLGSRPSVGRLHFHPVCEQGFLWDLASSNALITNAGNQLVGEAMFLGKPVLAIPEARNFEQQINARFLEAGGGGEWCNVGDLNVDTAVDFLQRADRYRDCSDRYRLNGNAAAIAALSRHLPARVDSSASTAVSDVALADHNK